MPTDRIMREPFGIEHRFYRSDEPAPVAAIAGIQARGLRPLLTVEPWKGVGAPASWGAALRGLGPIDLRFGHEMNGRWYPWSNRASDYLRMWAAWAGAMPENVRMLWCPNIDYPGAQPMRWFWPGADAVGAVGLDVYNRAGNPPNPWATFGALAASSLRLIRNLAPGKPIILAEVASPRGDHQPEWIKGMWSYLDGEDDVEAVCWLNQDKEQRWAFSAAGLAAFSDPSTGADRRSSPHR